MHHPLLFQINTRVVLNELGAALGRQATLDDLPDSRFDDLARRGFQWVWLLGVWQTGPMAREVSRRNPQLRAEFAHTLPDLTDNDISGSPYAIQAYTVSQDFGGDAALARLRKRLADRGLKLLLDFVVNHCSLDSPWTRSHPEYFIQGTEADLAREPHNYTRLTGAGPRILAYGRDPYFAGWPDTLQINYRHRGARDAMAQELERIAERADGVRCDMAMLVLPNIFQQTWADQSLPSDGSSPVDSSFWPEAIARVRRTHPDFLFMAEVYWDLEWQLQQVGFDYTYDKRLYDRLVAGQGRAVREHLLAAPDYQDRSVRFLENHDEPRAAATFAPAQHRAAAIITFLVPGLRFFHEGQFEGRKVRVSMHLGRRPVETPDAALVAFYDGILACLRRPEAHDGAWNLLACRPAWEGNASWESFTACSWDAGDGRRLLAVANYSPAQGQCYLQVNFPGLLVPDLVLSDLMSTARYPRSRAEIATSGLFLDLPAWGYHVFDVRAAQATPTASGHMG